MLERCEDVSEVGQPVLGPGLLENDEAVRSLAAFNGGLPLAVAAVERQNLGTGGKPQHIAEIIGLVAVELDPAVLGKGGVDEQAGAAEIVGGHRSKVQFAAVLNRKQYFRGKFCQTGASARRALALIDGLLRAGGNRKIASTLVALQLGRRRIPQAPAGETALMIRHLMVPITAAMVTMGAVCAYAQGFPAPLPGQAPTSSAFPPVNGSAPTASVGGAPQSSFP
jgi:hypothetical protein